MGVMDYASTPISPDPAEGPVKRGKGRPKKQPGEPTRRKKYKIQTDWQDFERQYRLGDKSVKDLAKIFGLTKVAAIQKIIDMGMIRDGIGLKREIVDQYMAVGEMSKIGVADGHKKSDMLSRLHSEDGVFDPTSIDRALKTQADQDISDMDKGLLNARRVLTRVCAMLDDDDLCGEPKNLDLIVGVNLKAIDTIRKIRGLDKRTDEVGMKDFSAVLIAVRQRMLTRGHHEVLTMTATVDCKVE